MADNIVKKENAKISQSKKSTKRRNFGRQQFPYMDLCPREKQSYLNSISRIHKGRLRREMKKEQTIVKLPFPSKRVKFRPLRCKSVSQCSNPPCNSSCCNSKHNGRFPSLAENRLVFSKNGNISVQRKKQTRPSAAYVDLLNLPPIPLNLKTTKSFISNQIYCACPFKSRTTVITEKDLDLIIPQLIKQHPTSGSSSHMLCRSPYHQKLNTISRRVTPIQTANIRTLETLWCKELRELQKDMNRRLIEHPKTKFQTKNLTTNDQPVPYKTIFTDMQDRDLFRWSNGTPNLDCPERSLPIACLATNTIV
ncbi:hypothetical protein EWB00_009088 [Schistosoma japonicum]|uniref:Uncharacterized protein n=1 Tax=Schistosoma japonicum TaxID=6182 RepID=A0A4Z2DS97_SCHJA|nr:hypothetical protein EWB00_009088 [Schistosoma japonicum]